ncbi:SGNH/GDSL hydrolase family protein [Leptospira soteropolitanensis]|nr:SGNH/GDSL hydrolase family protein [Leptospira soteropolitanensis]MCW7493512.1 SGNH/GDSL hydrolase family protein [Leptospira soteropolitanensis]
MKKVNDVSLFPTSKFRKVILFFGILVGLLFVCRFFDFVSLYFESPYGHYHFPKNREIPFFRLGEKEIGKMGEFGTRIGNWNKNSQCKYLLLGDSQVFGSGIFWKDTFPEILNRETKCSWINLGIPGFTLENELSLYRTIRTHISFDRVYLFVYGNDIFETGDTPDYLHFVKRQYWYFRALSFLFPEQTRIHLKNKYFESIQKRMEVELGKIAKLNNQVSPNSQINKENFVTLKGLFNLSPDYLRGSLDTKSYAATNFNRWHRILRQFNGNILSDKKELVMVYIPLEIEYDPKMFQIYKEIGFVMDSRWLDSDSEFITDLKIISKEERIPLIDLRESMRFRTDLLQSGDIHLNESAHRMIANTLKQSL